MSQYPNPYQSPGQASYPPAADAPPPARRAGILMIVLGSLTFLLGGCLGLIGAALPTLMRQMPPAQTKVFQDLEDKTGLPAGKMFLAFGGSLLLGAALYIVLGFFVRRGGLGSVVTSIVLTSLTVLFLLLNIATSLLTGPDVMGACVGLMAIVLFGLLLVFLIQAIPAAGNAQAAQLMRQAQYLQHQQMMQQHQPMGYGYSVAPPPAAASDASTSNAPTTSQDEQKL